MGCHWNAMTLDVTFWHLFWSKKTSKFYGNVMTFWWNSTGFLWEKGIPVKCHENVMKFQCHSLGLKMQVHFDGIIMENVHGIVMEVGVIFDQNSDGMKWWHFIMRGSFVFISMSQLVSETWIFTLFHVNFLNTLYDSSLYSNRPNN